MDLQRRLDAIDFACLVNIHDYEGSLGYRNPLEGHLPGFFKSDHRVPESFKCQPDIFCNDQLVFDVEYRRFLVQSITRIPLLHQGDLP